RRDLPAPLLGRRGPLPRLSLQQREPLARSRAPARRARGLRLVAVPSDARAPSEESVLRLPPDRAPRSARAARLPLPGVEARWSRAVDGNGLLRSRGMVRGALGGPACAARRAPALDRRRRAR